MNRRPTKRKPGRRPFWLPASTFYFLAAAIALGIFFLSWAILQEGAEQSPWIGAGLLASSTMIGAVVLREVVMRNRRERVLAAQRRLDNSVLSVPIPFRSHSDPDKLTLEKNAILLDEIRRRSIAANALGRSPDSHAEVVSMCEAYIEVAVRELPNIGVGSPRLVSISRGRAEAEALHRTHMLKWAELESKARVRESSTLVSLESKLENAVKAQRALERALESYPSEISLIESRDLIEAMTSAAEAAVLIEGAERAEADGDLLLALDKCREAERSLGLRVDDNDILRNQTRDHIERLEKLVGLG